MKIYNSLTRRKDPFAPIKKNRIGMYVCGPTVYDEAHLGHARAAYIFEVIRSYFEYQGYKVKFVKNITDVDDKIITKAKEEFPDQEINKACSKVAGKYTRRYYNDMKALGIRRASITPFATKHIGHMTKYIDQLIKKGFAYESNSSVYFDVRKFKEYGQLSGQDLDAMGTAARTEKDDQKKSPLDFALWKSAKENEPFWMSPWGKGRPGWHIECSVMSSKYLGNEFDIHGGGRDLIFPHHENENAQSRAFSGKQFAHCWIHNGLLTINSQKMAKSLGNFITVGDFLKDNTPSVLKLFFLSAHYRSPIDFNEERIHEAKKAYERFEIFYNSARRKIKGSGRKSEITGEVLQFKKRIDEAMDDDFNTPEALAALFDLVTFCNKLLTDYSDKDQKTLEEAVSLLEDVSTVFGISFDQAHKTEASDTEIDDLIKRREQLRKAQDFAQADKIRVELEEKGIILEDTKEGAIWRRKL